MSAAYGTTVSGLPAPGAAVTGSVSSPMRDTAVFVSSTRWRSVPATFTSLTGSLLPSSAAPDFEHAPASNASRTMPSTHHRPVCPVDLARDIVSSLCIARGRGHDPVLAVGCRHALLGEVDDHLGLPLRSGA